MNFLGQVWELEQQLEQENKEQEALMDILSDEGLVETMKKKTWE